MTKITFIGAAIAAIALTACGQNEIDPRDAVVRNGPQIQSPIADAPFGKLPDGGPAVGSPNGVPVVTGGASATATPVIIDDSAPAAASGSIFEFQS